MEHRWYRRVKTDFAVNLYTSGGAALRNCRASNISMGGIVVNVSDHNDVLDHSTKNSVINVELRAKEFSATLPCLILRSNGQSMALMFIKYHPGLREFLSRLRLQENNAGVELKTNAAETYVSPHLPAKIRRRAGN